MAAQTPFSRRYETRKPETGLFFDSVPDRVKDGLLNMLRIRRVDVDAAAPDSRLTLMVYLGLDREPVYSFVYLLRHLIDWDEFCDVCDLVIAYSDDEADAVANELNDLFARHYFGYEVRGGRMEKVGASSQDAAIAEARGILRDPDLAGPDEQYQKAVGFFNRRPEPDCENCVKEAVSALEGVARILLDDDSLTLSKALDKVKREKGVHAVLIDLLQKLYAYRGDAEGVAHARTTADGEVRVEDAEFTLAVSASAIVYLARLYGRGVE